MGDVMGYSLCNDVEDSDKKMQMRATIMTNIIEDNIHKKSGKITEEGRFAVLAYEDAIPDEERDGIKLLVKRFCTQRGLI